MKKNLLILATAVLAFNFSVKAQFISPSADDFEVWSTDIANSSAMDPNSGAGSIGWQSLNILSGSFTGSSPVSCYQETSNVHSGSYSCKLTSVVLTSTSYGYVKGFLPHDTAGIVAVGELTISPSLALKLGVPHTQRITEAPKFWYQYMPQTGAGKPDTAFCTITLSHYSGGKRNILGGGYVQMKAASAWTLDSVPIVYDSLSGNPDSVQVFFSSSSLYAPVPGSTLYLDGVSAVTGINNLTAPTASVNVFPNPATTEVNISVSNGIATQADIYDITGQKIHSYQLKNSLSSISTSTYNPGLYFYKLYDRNGNELKMGKFTVTR